MKTTNRRIRPVAMALVLGFFALLLALSVLLPLSGPAEAAPPLAPTPVANLAPSNSALNVTFQATTGITQDTNTNSKQLISYEYMDISITVDHGTVNTTTFTVQFSNDDTNWDDGPALISNSAADATDITRVPLFGRYVRIKQDVTNSNLLTTTILAVAK